MEERNLYDDIARRTDGDIYIGVVGPVRTGKSTLIKKFMDLLILPNMSEEARRERAVDEMPQSAAGRTITTTEPKFLPEQSVSISVDESVSFNVRMIDCVGYIVPSALGYVEEEMPRMVMTPWYEEPIPFNMAAEIGTRKVITEHSTIGLVVTTDGTIGEIPREEYEEAEERVIEELKEIRKPFVILLNSVSPEAPETAAMAKEMEQRHGVAVLPVSCLDMTEETIREILSKVLFEFPLREISVEMPGWLTRLEKTHWLRSAVLESIREAAAPIERIKEIRPLLSRLQTCEHIGKASAGRVDLGRGSARIVLALRPDLFFKVIAEETGIDVSDESDLLSCMTEFCHNEAPVRQAQGSLRTGAGDRLRHRHAGDGRDDAGGAQGDPPEREVRRAAQGQRHGHPHDEDEDLRGGDAHGGVGAAVGGADLLSDDRL